MQDDGLRCVGPAARALPWLLLGAIRVVVVLHDVTAVTVVGLVVRGGLGRILCKHKSQSLCCEQQGFHKNSACDLLGSSNRSSDSQCICAAWLALKANNLALKIYPAECKKWQHGIKREKILRTII